MKVHVKTPVPVKPDIVVELTQYEAQVLKRVVQHVLVCGPEGDVTYKLYSELCRFVGDDPEVRRPRVSKKHIHEGYLTFEEED